MIGVVVWANEIREKAIIWCEDQATLAYLQERQNLSNAQQPWPQPGDLVELETETIGNLRHARAVSLICEKSCPQIPQILATGDSAQPEVARLRVVSSGDAVRSQPEAVDPGPSCYLRSGAAS